MSVRNVGRVWLAAYEDVTDVLLREKVVQSLKPTMIPIEAHGVYASLYARYVMIVNQLGYVYDQTLQVQKREAVRRILEFATDRMLAMQDELKYIEMSEFLYLDKTLIEEKWRPEQIQLLCPFYYPILRKKEVQDIIDGVRKPPPPKEEEEGAEKKTPLQLLLEEKARLEALEANKKEDPVDVAIKMIKVHEKARQDRCLFNYMKMHPELYAPKPPPAEEVKMYAFYHKPDTPMLVPVVRTKYESNYYKVLRSFSKVKFYENPTRQKKEEGIAKGKEREVETEIEIENIIENENEKETAADTTVTDEKKQSPDLDIVDEVIIDARRESIKTENIAIMEVELRTEEADEEALRNEAATKIQRCFLHFRIKRLVRQSRLNHMIRIGMTDERKWDYKMRDEVEARTAANKLRKAAFDEAFRQACLDTKARIFLLRSPWIMEDISDHIRFWFWEMYDVGGEMDVFPPAAKGGTILVVRGETATRAEFVEVIKQRQLLAAMTPEQRQKKLDDEKKKKREEKKMIKAAKKAKAKARQEKLLNDAKKGKTWDFADEYDFVTQDYLGLDKSIIEYKRDFRFIDEFANIKSKPYMDWVEEDIYAELHTELRGVVDEMMRVEYELLRIAHCKDNKLKYKPTKAPKAKKKGKKKKEKAEKPIEFGERDAEEVYDSFLEAGVIVETPNNRLDDYIGDRNWIGYELRNYYDKDPQHYMGEVKDVLRQYIFGMGDLTSKHPQSICIMGPPGCGKKYMINALAREMGLVKFDISPHIVAKFKDDLNLFTVDLMKMAKLMQPSMLFIDGAHNPFIKKIDPEMAQYEPRLIAKYLPKMLKGIKPADRIMLMATTNQPWNGAAAKMNSTYQVSLLSGGTDYGSTLLLWRSALLSLYGTDRLMDFSALSKVTKFYGAQQILDTVKTIVDLRRRVYLERRPLNQRDLLENLFESEPPYNFPMPETELQKYNNAFVAANKYQKLQVASRKAKEAKGKKKI